MRLYHEQYRITGKLLLSQDNRPSGVPVGMAEETRALLRVEFGAIGDVAEDNQANSRSGKKGISPEAIKATY